VTDRSGLTSEEARARLEHDGPNALPEPAPIRFTTRLLRQFASPLIYLLIGALAFDLAIWVVDGMPDWPLEATAIALILLLNAGLGVYQEQRSEAALARLKAMAASQAWVWRDGALVHIPVRQIARGDLARIDAGDRIAADGRLLDAGVLVDESVLTGESVPVDKAPGDEIFSGTLAVRGQSRMEVLRTGPESAMGRLATMLEGVTPGKTPLERRVQELGRQIARWVVALAGALGLLGILAEGVSRAPEVIVFAVALAVAAVPEGLPAVLTVALALGVERMSRHKALVRRLVAVEALGSITVIATDKTGTLTEGRMDVQGVDVTDADRATRAMVLANDAEPDAAAGDPMDLGLLRYVSAQGVDVAALRAAHEVVEARPFDSEWKFARATVRSGAGDATLTYVKGAPEAVIGRSRLAAAERAAWIAKADRQAAEGFRVLALAWREGAGEDDLTLLGLVLFWDPPRAEVAASIRRAQAAGIRVLMVTGDHPATARAIASRIGIADTRVTTGDELAAADAPTRSRLAAETHVFARVQPQQKLQLVETLQASHAVVAMTGDGVNDAAALKRADVGVAMGQRGSDVTREVADLVLLDDNFATIVQAVDEGRGIYENVQSFLRFLFSTNLSEVLFVATGTLLAFAIGMRDETGALVVPLTAAQILWMNLLTDGLPALALAFDRTPGVMDRPPRAVNAPLLDRPSMRFIAGAGLVKAAIALAGLAALPRLGYSLDETRAAAFHFMAIGQLLLTYPARRSWTIPRGNPYLHAAVAGGVALQLGAAWLPWTSEMLGGAWMPLDLWLVVAAASLVVWASCTTIARLVWRQRPAMQA
jgi:Ca2+-transporting ATPase